MICPLPTSIQQPFLPRKSPDSGRVLRDLQAPAIAALIFPQRKIPDVDEPAVQGDVNIRMVAAAGPEIVENLTHHADGFHNRADVVEQPLERPVLGQEDVDRVDGRVNATGTKQT
jgi:hypothetical protein